MCKILITGGTGKIGKILLEAMLKDGHSVVFTTTQKNKGQELLDQLNTCTDQVAFIVSKFKDEHSVKDITMNLPFEVDTIIHNARSIETLKIEQSGYISADQFNEELFMAVTFPYLLSHELVENGHPIKDIIFISSIYGVVVPNPCLYENFEMQSPINYGVAKAAQIHLSKELAVRYSKKGVRVNCISFGGVEGRVDDKFKERYSSLNPLNRMLNETDLYPPVQFLLNNPSLAITGENIKIDGGWTTW